MLRASISGSLDYSKLDFRSPTAAIREFAVLEREEVEGLSEFALAYAGVEAQAAAAAANPAELFKSASSKIKGAMLEAYPYLGNNGKKKMRGNLRERWAAAYGDLNDPEVQRKVKEAEEKMLDTARNARAEKESAMIAALRPRASRKKARRG